MTRKFANICDRPTSQRRPIDDQRQRVEIVDRERPALRSTKDTQRMLGIGHTKLYELLAQGRLTALKIGRKTLITDESIERLIGEAPVAQIGHRVGY